LAHSLREAGVAAERADLLAALVVSAVEGAIVLSRAERDPAPLLDAAAELEDVIAAGLG
jgi:TetR/AcrR family transcriptional regulator, lmrAB and yxaGH operons repressor